MVRFKRKKSTNKVFFFVKPYLKIYFDILECPCQFKAQIQLIHSEVGWKPMSIYVNVENDSRTLKLYKFLGGKCSNIFFLISLLQTDDVNKQLNIWFKKQTVTIHSTLSLLWIVTVFLNQTLIIKVSNGHNLQVVSGVLVTGTIRIWYSWKWRLCN